MPEIRVKMFANFREYTKTKEIELEGETVKDILEVLCNKFPGLEKKIFEGGNIRPHINIFLNGDNIFESSGLDLKLHENDEIAIFPPVSGGLCSRNE